MEDINHAKGLQRIGGKQVTSTKTVMLNLNVSISTINADRKKLPKSEITRLG